MGWFDSILRPIMWLVAWIMYGAHYVFALMFGKNSGVAWILAIVMLVVVMRVIMIPLFVRQIRSSRSMQLIQPELQKLQARYKGKTDPVSKRRQQEEMMALYRKHGANPLSSCLPILAQSPFFFALFRMLYSLPMLAAGTYKDGSVKSIGPINAEVADQVIKVKLFGAPLSSTFMNQTTWGDASPLTVRLVTVILIIAMSVTTFTTQRQLTMKNMPASAKDNPMFRTQKIMLWMFPLIFAVSGVNFPIGVLIYWLTTNLWSMGQQFFVIRRMPQPGSEAEKKYQARQAKKRAKKGLPENEPESPASSPGGQPRGQRVQPKKTTRAQRRTTAPGTADAETPAGKEARAGDGTPEGKPAGKTKPGQETGGESKDKAVAESSNTKAKGKPKSGPDAAGTDQGRMPPSDKTKGKSKAASGDQMASFGRGTTAQPGGPTVTPSKGGQRPQPKKSARKKRK